MDIKPESIITFEIEGMTFQQTEKMRQSIEACIMNGVFHIKNGKVILNFDQDGTLQTIAYDYIKWKRAKEISTLAKP